MNVMFVILKILTCPGTKSNTENLMMGKSSMSCDILFHMKLKNVKEIYGLQGERLQWTDEAAFVLTVLLFSLLDVSKMGSHFHDFNNVQNQIQASKEI